MMRVLNKYLDGFPPRSVNIMRGTPFGNQYEIGPDGSREEVVAKYEKDLRYKVRTEPVFASRVKNLFNRDLVCVCAPRLCHGTVLRKVCLELNGMKP